MKIKSVYPCYTGGNIYVFLGAIDNGQYFIADSDYYDVRFIDTDPLKADFNDEVFQPEWQESHLIRDLSGQEQLSFFIDTLNFILVENPEGNYQPYDIEILKNDLIERGIEE